jgi:murein DD-endopeptidase MepM/ murein hydrolase activator NlpD
VQFVRTLLPVTVLAAAVPSAPAWADGGGAAPPSRGGAAPPSESGGTRPGDAVPRREAPRGRARRRAAGRARGPVLTSFSLRRPRLFLYGHPAQVSFRIRGRSPVEVRLELRRPPARVAAWRVPLGRLATGVTHTVPLTGLEQGVLPPGSYELRIAGRDRRGSRLRRGPQAASSVGMSFFHHRFPLVGPFDYGGDGSRFGAPRSGRTHGGQDLAAAEGTPIVAPRGGVVETVQYQAGGAGHYVVLDGEREDRDYVFMHMRSGSVVVEEGQRVRTGQRIGDVGNTGHSTGPHLHFEVWVGGWFQDGGEPIDPLPLLRAWDAWS